MGIFALLMPLLTSIGGTVAKSMFPSAEDDLKREQLKTAFTSAILENASKMEEAAAGIVKAEAQSVHWLTANWRPLTMLTFVSLIVARWFGWDTGNLSEAEAIELWGIVKLGLGGYVIGRSAEKVMPQLVEALGSMKK